MKASPENTSIIVPTLNPGPEFSKWCKAFETQKFKPHRLYVIDSSSDDGTVLLAESAGFDVLVIPRNQFDHGGTRQLVMSLLPEHIEIAVFLTQDAIFDHPETLHNLLLSFDDPKVGAAYGRQLPNPNATPIEAYNRFFNYPEHSRIKSVKDQPELGIKTVFLSNAFAAYRRSALMSVGGFPSKIIFGEDTYVAAKMLLAEWKIAYCAEAKVFHSHNYGYFEEFKRYFDIGVLHYREPWIRETFGKAENEGIRFVRSELKYLWIKNPLLIPSACIRNILKLLGYRLGALERYLPLRLKRILSKNRNYWC